MLLDTECCKVKGVIILRENWIFNEKQICWKLDYRVEIIQKSEIYSIFIEVGILIFHFGLFLDSFFRFVFEIERSGKIKIFFKYFWK